MIVEDKKGVCPGRVLRQLLGSVVMFHTHFSPTPDDFLDIAGELATTIANLEGRKIGGCYECCVEQPDVRGDVCPANLYESLRRVVDKFLQEGKITTIWDLQKIEKGFKTILPTAKSRRVKELSELNESLKIVKTYKLFSGRMTNEEVDNM